MKKLFMFCCDWAVVIITATIVCFSYLYIFPKRITVTELLHKYKNYVITEKYEFRDKCIIRIKNPYQFDPIHKPLEVPSGVYYNYSVGDTIGKNKQTYLNIY